MDGSHKNVVSNLTFFCSVVRQKKASRTGLEQHAKCFVCTIPLGFTVKCF